MFQPEPCSTCALVKDMPSQLDGGMAPSLTILSTSQASPCWPLSPACEEETAVPGLAEGWQCLQYSVQLPVQRKRSTFPVVCTSYRRCLEILTLISEKRPHLVGLVLLPGGIPSSHGLSPSPRPSPFPATFCPFLPIPTSSGLLPEQVPLYSNFRKWTFS